ncbi:hypothetical protein P5V15_000592 [Pogonomyrmex californicus]
MRADRVRSIVVQPVDRVYGGVDRPSRRQHRGVQQGQQHVSGTRDRIINARTARRRHEPWWIKRGDARHTRRMWAGARGEPLDRVVACRSRGRGGGGGGGGERGGREERGGGGGGGGGERGGGGGGGGGGKEVRQSSSSRADRGQPD